MTAAATHSSSNLAPGYKLDRYELLCPIAEGGMASVWVARQRGKHGFEKLVAIKTILPIFASDVRFQAMFLDEARIASRIEHANVAQILDLGEEHDVLYLAMEYVDGDALSKLNHACQKEGARIPPGILLRVLADTCAGLHEAHELLDASGHLLEIVHRDVSPHNILINTRGIAKLIDFGIAKARSRAGGETNSGVLKGKIQYMAPEQALGRPVDRRADVWAIGVILYYLLTGKPPYEAENQLATLHLLASGRPPVPLPPSVHPIIAAVVRKALAYTPENRYQTAAHLRDGLERAMLEAKVETTQVDVAAFVAKHLAERAEKRRQAIDLALTAAAERMRVENLLRPSSEISASGIPHPFTAAATGTAATPGLWRPPDPSSHSLMSQREATRAEVPNPRWTPGMAEIPRGDQPSSGSTSSDSRSYSTIGSAALDASEPLLPVARSRKPVTVLILCGLAAAALTIGWFARPKVPPPSVAAQSTVVAPPRAVSVLPPPPPVAQPSPPPPPATPVAVDPSSLVPVVSASSLPKAKDPGAPPVRWGAPPVSAAGNTAASTPQAASAKPKPKSQSVDDGF